MDPRNQPSLLERIYSWENLLDAYHEAASEKWYRNDVTAFAANLEENLISIQNDLIWHTYKVGRYRQFYVHEPKKRLVMALGFRDRVVQWAIYLQTNQYLDNGMIYHSYGCRVGKGTTRAADRLQYWCTIGLVKRGITFVGCRIYPGYRKPTAQSVKKMKARMRYIAKEYEAGLIDFDAVDATMQSYFGLMGHCSTHGLQKWIEKNIIFKRKEMADIELPQEVTQWELNQF